MTDYEIQKATASKVGVVSSPDNIYECRKAILEKLGGDSTDADTIYECDKRILPLIGGGSANLQSKSVDITENGNTTYSPDSGFDGFSDFSVNVNVPPTPTQEKSVNITENGTTSVVPDEGYNLSSVNVNVDVPPTPTPTQEKSVNITENGTQRIVPDAGYNLSGVDVNVNVAPKKAVINAEQIKFTNASVIDDNIEIVGLTTCYQMFYNCSSLTSVPKMDTSKVTDMGWAFGYTAISTIPAFDTSNVKSMVLMFSGCRNLITIPALNTSKVTNMGQMFDTCKNLTSVPEMDTSKVTDMGYMFSDCLNLTYIPQIDTSKVTNMGYMFSGCKKLITIPTLNMSNVNNVGNMFGYSRSPVSNLTNLGGLTDLGKAFTSAQTLNISSSYVLTNQSVQNIIDTVFDMNQNNKGGSATITLSQTVIDAMTDEQKSQLSAKGWTLTN